MNQWIKITFPVSKPVGATLPRGCRGAEFPFNHLQNVISHVIWMDPNWEITNQSTKRTY